MYTFRGLRCFILELSSIYCQKSNNYEIILFSKMKCKIVFWFLFIKYEYVANVMVAEIHGFYGRDSCLGILRGLG